MPFPPAATTPKAVAGPLAAEAHWPSRVALAEPAVYTDEAGAWKNVRGTVAQSHRLLEQRVAERTAELLASNERLQAEINEHRRAEAALREADRHKDEFLAMLAHELRNPLAPIRNSVEVLRRLAIEELSSSGRARRSTAGPGRGLEPGAGPWQRVHPALAHRDRAASGSYPTHQRSPRGAFRLLAGAGGRRQYGCGREHGDAARSPGA